MFEKDKLYFGNIRGDTLSSFVFHFVMMFLFPISGFFAVRRYLRDANYPERDCTTYAGFAAVAAVQVVIIHYVIHIVRDQDNWKKDEPKVPIKNSKTASVGDKKDNKEELTVETSKKTENKPADKKKKNKGDKKEEEKKEEKKTEQSKTEQKKDVTKPVEKENNKKDQEKSKTGEKPKDETNQDKKSKKKKKLKDD